MNISLRLGLIIVSLILLLIVLSNLKKEAIPVKYALIWFLSSFIIFLIGLFPGIFIWIANLLGFITMSNMVIGMFIFILLIITMALTIIVSSQKKKITLLIQEVSMLKEKISNEKK